MLCDRLGAGIVVFEYGYYCIEISCDCDRPCSQCWTCAEVGVSLAARSEQQCPHASTMPPVDDSAVLVEATTTADYIAEPVYFRPILITHYPLRPT